MKKGKGGSPSSSGLEVPTILEPPHGRKEDGSPAGGKRKGGSRKYGGKKRKPVAGGGDNKGPGWCCFAEHEKLDDPYFPPI